MTKDEVMATSKEELQIKAAELMGWLFIPLKDCPDGWREIYDENSQQGVITLDEKRSVLPISGDLNVREAKLHSYPDYPNNIVAAWELLSAIPGIRWGIHELSAGGWTAFAMKRSEPGWVNCGDAEGNTAPLAITRAFVLAMENSED